MFLGLNIAVVGLQRVVFVIFGTNDFRIPMWQGAELPRASGPFEGLKSFRKSKPWRSDG